MDSLSELVRRYKAKNPEKKAQATRHQDDAVRTAELFKDMKYLGRYLRLFSRNTARRHEILEIRDWVETHGKNGKIFFAVCSRNNLK